MVAYSVIAAAALHLLALGAILWIAISAGSLAIANLTRYRAP